MGKLHNVKYEARFNEMLIEHMNEGGSLVGFVKHLYDTTGIKVCRKTLYNWRDQHEEFAESLEFGKELAQGYYERIATRGLWFIKDEPNINTALLTFILKTRFKDDWSPKPEEGDSSSLDSGLEKLILDELRKTKEIG